MIVGRFAFALITPAIRELFDLAIAAAFALTLTLTYRRWMRRYLAERRAGRR